MHHWTFPLRHDGVGPVHSHLHSWSHQPNVQNQVEILSGNPRPPIELYHTYHLSIKINLSWIISIYKKFIFFFFYLFDLLLHVIRDLNCDYRCDRITIYTVTIDMFFKMWITIITNMNFYIIYIIYEKKLLY